MPRTHVEPEFLYSQLEYESAVRNYHVGGVTAPQCLRWKLASRRDPGRYARLEADWPSLSLEEKIGKLAVLIGTYIRGDKDSPAHVITYGYELLCRRGSLTA